MHVYMAAVYSNNYMPGQNRYVKLNDRERQAVTEIPLAVHYVFTI